MRVLEYNLGSHQLGRFCNFFSLLHFNNIAWNLFKKFKCTMIENGTLHIYLDDLFPNIK